MKAIIVVDMLNDFVTGSLKCDRAQRIIQPLQKLLSYARKEAIPVIYSNDCHLKLIDHELSVWGEHAMIGTDGAKVITELEPKPYDHIIPKRRYSGFFQTDLQLLLTELGVNTLVLTGLHVNMCVRHTAADAFYWGYRLLIPRDGTEALSEKDYVEGLEYLEKVYGAKIISINDIVKEIV